jgi:hypothetical protein
MRLYTLGCLVCVVAIFFAGCKKPDDATFKGSYTTTLTHGNLPGSPEMTGTWEITFDGAGKYSLRHDKLLVIQGEYSVSQDTLRVEKEVGMGACTATTPGMYRITRIDTGLKLDLVGDECPGRVLVLAMFPLAKQKES